MKKKTTTTASVKYVGLVYGISVLIVLAVEAIFVQLADALVGSLTTLMVGEREV